MALKEGEVYACPNPDCAAEMRVTRSAKSSCQGTAIPRCCCGSQMVLQSVAAPAGQR